MFIAGVALFQLAEVSTRSFKGNEIFPLITRRAKIIYTIFAVTIFCLISFASGQGRRF